MSYLLGESRISRTDLTTEFTYVRSTFIRRGALSSAAPFDDRNTTTGRAYFHMFLSSIRHLCETHVKCVHTLFECTITKLVYGLIYHDHAILPLCHIESAFNTYQTRALTPRGAVLRFGHLGVGHSVVLVSCRRDACVKTRCLRADHFWIARKAYVLEERSTKLCDKASGFMRSPILGKNSRHPHHEHKHQH
jgi:hypothetical protein